jgi:hypothetical protein
MLPYCRGSRAIPSIGNLVDGMVLRSNRGQVKFGDIVLIFPIALERIPSAFSSYQKYGL